MAATGSEVVLLDQLKMFKDHLDANFPSVDIVKVDEHSTSYTRDTLEIICDDTGKVTAMYFVSV